MPNTRTYSKYAAEAVSLLGKQIKAERKFRRLSESELAERAGISRATLQKIENGEMTCAIGLVFEVASIVGLTLFESDHTALRSQLKRTEEKLSLLPRRIREKPKEIDDDF
ncbi:MAG TPA: helix-turn-helix transcriptional regulator [Cyclobacteriaceae bacterium]|nr:helix-turn-helix transcriptional regulator [Cyclobacteriaceae bacterium]